VQVFVTFDESFWDNKQIGIFGVLRSLHDNWQFAFRILRPPINRSVPFTSPANEEFDTVGHPTPSDECALKISNLKKLDLELELTLNSVLVRGANSVRHHFPAPLNRYGRLQIFFMATSIDEEGEDWCWLPMEIVQKATSKYNIPPTTTPIPSFSPAQSDHSLQSLLVTTPYRRKKQKLNSSRRSTLTTRSLLSGKLTTSVNEEPSQTTTVTSIRPHRTELTPKNETFIDILNDRNNFDSVQRSRTREVNSAWRWSFKFYFVIQYSIVIGLVFFAVVMLVLLQIRPRQEVVTRVIVSEERF